MSRIRVAFVKFGGLSAGGTERWLQMMAANLPVSRFEVTYYFCDSAPYLGSDYVHAGTDPHRRRYLEDAGVELVEFHVGAKDVRTPDHRWVDTDFWEVFRPEDHDLVQTAKARVEYPYHLLDMPVVEYVTLRGPVDPSRNIIHSIHLSEWQRGFWVRSGGKIENSSVIPIPALPPATDLDLRTSLGIDPGTVVAGFHQRDDGLIASEIPLEAFSRIRRPGWRFVVMGGGTPYRHQAEELGSAGIDLLPHTADAVAISQFLNTLDVFAHGRWDGETFGTVFAEAMVHGTPCLSHASATGNNAQVETMGPAGLFAADTPEYAQYLERLMSDGELRQRLGSAGRAHAIEYYSLESAVAELAALYEHVLEGEQRPFRRRALPYGHLADLGVLYAGRMDSSEAARCVLLGGTPEPRATYAVTEALSRVAGRLVDVGAGDGLHTLVALKAGPDRLRAVAYEGDSADRANLAASVAVNGWAHRATVSAPTGDLADAGAGDVLRLGHGAGVTLQGTDLADRLDRGVVAVADGREVETCRALVRAAGRVAGTVWYVSAVGRLTERQGEQPAAGRRDHVVVVATSRGRADDARLHLQQRLRRLRQERRAELARDALRRGKRIVASLVRRRPMRWIRGSQRRVP